MAKLLKWFVDTSSKLLDPQREQRISAAADFVKSQIAAQQKSFNFRVALQHCDLFDDESPVVARKVYRSFVDRAFRDRNIDDRERSALDWIARALELSQPARTEVERDAIFEAFDQQFATAMSDGNISELELEQLRGIASQLRLDLGSLMKTRFGEQLEAHARSLFFAIRQDGVIAASEWTALLGLMAKVGMTHGDVCRAVRVPARQFVEQVLADAKSDGHLSHSEIETIEWLIEHTIDDPAYIAYVRGEVSRVLDVQAIVEGKLPSVAVDAIGLRAGEIVHLYAYVQYVKERRLRSGPVLDRFEGELMITDDRLLFHAPGMGLDINHRRVSAVQAVRGGFEWRTTGKQGGWFYFDASSFPNATLIYQVAVRKANQTITVSQDSGPSRHIPRDVRQRVWQTYSGRCAACGSDQYLEFDHIIPFARGGSSAEQNVQLLCRRCNLQKSDSI